MPRRDILLKFSVYHVERGFPSSAYFNGGNTRHYAPSGLHDGIPMLELIGRSKFISDPNTVSVGNELEEYLKLHMRVQSVLVVN